MSRQEMAKSKKPLMMAGVVLLVVLLFPSCTRDEEPASPPFPGNSLYVASAALTSADVADTGADTRSFADEIYRPVTSGSLGIFRSQGTGYTEALNNKKYTYDPAKGWQPATASDTLFLITEDADVCAYYPHSGEAAYQDPTAIPLRPGKYVGSSTQHDPNDICYAINRSLNAARCGTTFEMEHAMTLLEFRLWKDLDFPGECRITSITLTHPLLYSTSSIDITTGLYGTASPQETFTYNPGPDENGLLLEKNAVTTGVLLVPLDYTDDRVYNPINVSFTIKGRSAPVRAMIDPGYDALLYPGRRCRVRMAVKPNDVQVTGVDMLPWDEVVVGGNDYEWYPQKAIDIGLDFVIAPSNLRAEWLNAPSSSYYFRYYFPVDQGRCSVYDGESGSHDFFRWNVLKPVSFVDNSPTPSTWDDARDPCRQVGDGKWHTPTQAQLQQLVDLIGKGKAVWGLYSRSNGKTVPGWYFGTGSVPSSADKDKYVFLPAGGAYDITYAGKHDFVVGGYRGMERNGNCTAILTYIDDGSLCVVAIDNHQIGNPESALPIRCVMDK